MAIVYSSPSFPRDLATDLVFSMNSGPNGQLSPIDLVPPSVKDLAIRLGVNPTLMEMRVGKKYGEKYLVVLMPESEIMCCDYCSQAYNSCSKFMFPTHEGGFVYIRANEFNEVVHCCHNDECEYKLKEEFETNYVRWKSNWSLVREPDHVVIDSVPLLA